GCSWRDGSAGYRRSRPPGHRASYCRRGRKYNRRRRPPPTAECPAPAFGDLGSKGSQSIPVGWDCVVVEEAGDDLLQPFTLFGYRLMHPPSQFPRNLLDLRLHAVATGPPLEEEFAPARL